MNKVSSAKPMTDLAFEETEFENMETELTLEEAHEGKELVDAPSEGLPEGEWPPPSQSATPIMEEVSLPVEAVSWEGQEKPALRGQIEAVLFLTSHPLTVHEICEHLGTTYDETEEALVELIQDYAFREEGALEINDADGYILQVKDRYTPVVDQMVPMELPPALLRTLSAIALKAPVLQSDLVELRGSSVYEHIPELLKEKLISKRRQGRSYVLNVTPKFNEYFRLKGDKRSLDFLVTLGESIKK